MITLDVFNGESISLTNAQLDAMTDFSPQIGDAIATVGNRVVLIQRKTYLPNGVLRLSVYEPVIRKAGSTL